MVNKQEIHSMLKGFQKFIMKGNAVDMAVGVVVGAAFGSVVNAMVKDLVTPLIGAFGGTHDFSGIYFTLNNSKFMVGDFVNALISFLTISAVVYFGVVLPMNKFMARVKPTEDPKEEKCPECLSMIPKKAKRCKFCTAKLEK